jgi:hypothetical protein
MRIHVVSHTVGPLNLRTYGMVQVIVTTCSMPSNSELLKQLKVRFVFIFGILFPNDWLGDTSHRVGEGVASRNLHYQP